MCGLRGGLYNFKESYISELGSLHIFLWIICIESNVVDALQQIASFFFIFFSFFFFFCTQKLMCYVIPRNLTYYFPLKDLFKRAQTV